MGRLARVVAGRIPHHVTQRGNLRRQTFFREDDYREYISLMAEWIVSRAMVEPSS
jgi:putative transposase